MRRRRHGVAATARPNRSPACLRTPRSLGPGGGDAIADEARGSRFRRRRPLRRLPESNNMGHVRDPAAGAQIGETGQRGRRDGPLAGPTARRQPASALSTARLQEQASTVPLTPLLFRNDLDTLEHGLADFWFGREAVAMIRARSACWVRPMPGTSKQRCGSKQPCSLGRRDRRFAARAAVARGRLRAGHSRRDHRTADRHVAQLRQVTTDGVGRHAQ